MLDNFNRAQRPARRELEPAASGIRRVIRVNDNQANVRLAAALPLGAASGRLAPPSARSRARPSPSRTLTAVGDAAPVLKASGGTASAPARFIRVRLRTGDTVVADDHERRQQLHHARRPSRRSTFATGDTLTAVANADGSVDVWQTTAANVTTYVGHSAADAAFTGGGRIGMRLRTGTSDVDNFSGGNVP